MIPVVPTGMGSECAFQSVEACPVRCCRKTARLLAAERLRAPMRPVCRLSETRLGARGQHFMTVSVEQRYCSYPRCDGRCRVFGFSVGCYGRTEQLREALADSASRNRVGTDSCRPGTCHHARSSCGCGRGDVVGLAFVADRLHRPLHRHQLELGAASRLEAGIRLAGGRIGFAHVEQHHCPVGHALCTQPGELEPCHCTGWFGHRRFQRRAERYLLATGELCAQWAISLQLTIFTPSGDCALRLDGSETRQPQAA